ncbi:MAG TPA: hypothetical protein VM198_08665 [Longimicrobiales bacterium]|nr:hypothetical protein [Longimicrobiales bacterium]
MSTTAALIGLLRTTTSGTARSGISTPPRAVVRRGSVSSTSMEDSEMGASTSARSPHRHSGPSEAVAEVIE